MYFEYHVIKHFSNDIMYHVYFLYVVNGVYLKIAVWENDDHWTSGRPMLEQNQSPFLLFAVLGATNISTPCLIIYMRKFLNLNAFMYACVYSDWHDHRYKDSVSTIICFD